MIYPLVLKHSDEELAPKITGMLIDIENFTVPEIVNIAGCETALLENIEEAKKLL